MQGPESPMGYRVLILRGVWERIQTWGVLRVWGHCWAAACLFAGLWTLTYLGFRWLAVPFFAWILGHGLLFLLTQWNENWDCMIGAQMRRKYKGRYDAS
jgi:hypothetical protein